MLLKMEALGNNTAADEMPSVAKKAPGGWPPNGLPGEVTDCRPRMSETNSRLREARVGHRRAPGRAARRYGHRGSPVLHLYHGLRSA